MAVKKSLKELIDPSSKIGNYKESTGGGTPLAKGEKLEDHPEAKRVNQPRDEQGKFTYNAANRKPLKYGPSRGETVPPFLRGLQLTYAQKKPAAGSIVTKDGIYKFKEGISLHEFIETFKRYIPGEGYGEFGDLTEKIGKRGGRLGKVLTIGGCVEGVNDFSKETKKKGKKAVVKRFVNKKDEAKTKADKANKMDKMFEGPEKIDYELAKKDKGAFMEKHFDQIQECVDLAESKGLKINPDVMVDLMVENESTFDDIKDAIKNK